VFRAAAFPGRGFLDFEINRCQDVRPRSQSSMRTDTIRTVRRGGEALIRFLSASPATSPRCPDPEWSSLVAKGKVRQTLSQTAKTALVTGAGSGIGRGIAQALSEKGLRVALVGRDSAKLEQTRALLPKNAESALAIAADVADRASVGQMVDQVLAAFGSIDVLVCNAGTNVRNRSLETLDPADWDRMIATNLTGAYNLVHFVLPGMRKAKGGLIVQICSVSGIRASTMGGAGYSASKFGQSALGICLGREEGINGIRSTVIYPGEVNTPILDARPVAVPTERREVILQPEDVAAAVRFLVDLHPRAHVPELVIKPTVDDFF
jgi:NADP-dependent 3-hydroxy acid dehydrogenase YdfG